MSGARWSGDDHREELAMKKQLGLVAIAISLLGAAEPVGLASSDEAEALSTERKVHGVITELDSGSLTLTSEKAAVTGKIDPARTKVTINGHPGKVSDLKLTEHAKGELCLDDVWLVIDEH